MNDLHMHISFSLVRKQAESEKDTENIDKKIMDLFFIVSRNSNLSPFGQ